jgi:hypothetical protein
MTFRFNPWPRFGAVSRAVSLAAVSSVALLLLDTSPAAACTCGGPLEPTVAIARADVVFEGTPRDQLAAEADVGVPGYRGARRFDFEVARYFKGQLGPAVSVYTIDQGTACGRVYPLDEPHIVYAWYNDSGQLVDSACSNSHLSSSDADDGPALGSGVAPDPTLVESESRGCASSSLTPSPGSRPWLAAAAGLALLGWSLRRRAAR